MPIPDFEDGVYLPVGLHLCTWDDMVARFCNGGRRQTLCERMREMFQRASGCGFVQVIVGGSFTTAKPEPGDFDLAWIVNQDINKAAMKPECLELVESDKSKGRFGCDVFYLPIAGNAEKIQEYATGLFGYDRNGIQRGVLLLKL